MNRTQLILAATVALTIPAFAQAPASEKIEILKPGEGAKLSLPVGKGNPPESKKTKRAKGPTEITGEQATFNHAENTAIFTGKVNVKGPEFDISCDKLTIKLKKDNEADPNAQPKEPPKEGAPSEATGNIEEAICEGNVIITQDKPADPTKPGSKPSRYLAKGKRAVYIERTQALTVTGWPQILESASGKPKKQINAAVEGTRIIIFQSGNMDVDGEYKVILHESE